MSEETNEKIKLSICIPVYNNLELFENCLNAIAISIRDFEENVEIVISDNASEDSIFDCVNNFKGRHINIRVLYSSNEYNKGLAFNFHKTVEMSNGKFCWIIGSDDFVIKDGIASIINIIDKYKNINFISVAFAHLNLKDVYDEKDEDKPYHRLQEFIQDESCIRSEVIKNYAKDVVKWDELVDELYKNVMLGSVMSGVFKRSLWMSVNRAAMDKSPRFNSVENIYPHCVIYSKCMIGKPSYYISKPVIIVGDGARQWEGSSFWEGSLPVIYLKVWNEIIDVYMNGGLCKIQVFRCRLANGMLVGRYYYPYFRRKYILKQYIKNSEDISLSVAYKKMWYVPGFYIGLLKGIIREYLS